VRVENAFTPLVPRCFFRATTPLCEFWSCSLRQIGAGDVLELATLSSLRYRKFLGGRSWLANSRHHLYSRVVPIVSYAIGSLTTRRVE
jgi:hypothetical protein